MTLRSVQRSQRRSSTGAQPAQRTPSHNEKRSGTPDAARAGVRYKRRKTLSDARATRGRSAEEADDSERPARRASLRVAGGGKDGAKKAKRKEREEKPVSLVLPPIPSSAGPLFQVRAGLTDFRARQLAMAVEAGVTSEVVWALNALQLISFSLKDTWQQGAGPLSKAPQLLSALVSVVASWRACSLEITDAATWRAMRGGPEGGGPADSEPPGRGGGGSRSSGSGRLSRVLHDPLGERIRTYFPHSAGPPLPARPISALHPPSAEAWGRLLLCRDNDLLLLPAAGPLQVYRQVALLLASADPHVQATALSCVALAAHASPAAKYSLAREPHLLPRLLALVTAPHPLQRVVRRAAAMLLCLAREPRTHAAFQPLLSSLTRAAFASAPPAPHAAAGAAGAGPAAGAAVGDAAAASGGGKEKGGGEAEVSAALAEVVWRVSCEPGADDWRLPQGENVWGARECDM